MPEKPNTFAVDKSKPKSSFSGIKEKTPNFIYLSDMEAPSHLLDDDDIHDQLSKILKNVEKGYQDTIERVDSILDYWDIFYCRINDKQFYSGETKIYIPFVHNAVNARKTRFVNQIFPQSKRHVECISTDGTTPDAILSLAEHYITATKLRTQVMPALCVNGDVEGSYSIYIGWKQFERQIKRRVKQPIAPNGASRAEGQDDALMIETVMDGVPEVEIIADGDLCVLPATSDHIDHALSVGGSVSLIRRWSKAKVEQMADEGVIDADAADTLINHMEDVANKIGRRNTKKANTENMGTKISGKEVEVYETWAMLKVKEEKSGMTGGRGKRRDGAKESFVKYL